MKYILKPYNYKIPDKELLKDLRETTKTLGVLSISASLYDTMGKYNSKTVRAHFGSWNIAVEKAGLKIQKVNFCTERGLLENLKLVWDTLKRQPLVTDMRRPISAYSCSAYVNKFGSWRGALEAFVRKENDYPSLTKTSAARRRKKRKRRLDLNLAMRYKILKRDKYKCRLCGASPAISHGVTLHIDHIIPRSKNGETTPANLQTLCSKCNYGKGGKQV